MRFTANGCDHAGVRVGDQEHDDHGAHPSAQGQWQCAGGQADAFGVAVGEGADVGEGGGSVGGSGYARIYRDEGSVVRNAVAMSAVSCAHGGHVSPSGHQGVAAEFYSYPQHAVRAPGRSDVPHNRRSPPC